MELVVQLQEIVWCASGHMGLSSSGGRVKLEEGILESVIQLHDGGLHTSGEKYGTEATREYRPGYRSGNNS